MFLNVTIGEKGERQYVLAKDFSKITYDLTLHRGKNNTCL